MCPVALVLYTLHFPCVYVCILISHVRGSPCPSDTTSPTPRIPDQRSYAEVVHHPRLRVPASKQVFRKSSFLRTRQKPATALARFPSSLPCPPAVSRGRMAQVSGRINVNGTISVVNSENTGESYSPTSSKTVNTSGGTNNCIREQNPNCPGAGLTIDKLQRVRGLKIAHLNLQSLRPKIEQVRILMAEHKIHLLTMSETWLHDGINDAEISVENYTLIRNDRKGDNHGGVACYISNDITHRVITGLNCNSESCWIEINLNRVDLL